MNTWHDLTSDEALAELGTDSKAGLSEDEARSRLNEYGQNIYEQAEQDGVVKMVLSQFKDLANVILLLAGFLSLALAIREGHGYLEPIVIFAIIIMNIALAVTQERSAEKALEALQSLSNPTCTVLRGGSRIEIETADAVPGDILLLSTGDYVAADARLIESSSLSVDESSLTGESEPAEKSPDPVPESDAPVGDRSSMVFAGCLVTAGNATAVITSTGMNTEMGKIAGYLNNSQKIQTPLQKRLNRVSRMITVVAIASAAILVVVGLRQGEEFWALMLAAVSLAVAAVPETLQLIVTLSLTHSVRNMVEEHALVRKLPAVETLGNTSIICSDKTGTLTQNRMTIQKLWTPKTGEFSSEDEFSDEQLRFLEKLALASNATIEPASADDPDADASGTRVVGDATESAIVRLLTDKGIDLAELRADWPRVDEIPFSSSRKMMTSIHGCPSGGYQVITKGAFDRLPFEEADGDAIGERTGMHDEFANHAMRVIALGSVHVDELPSEEELESLERNLEFEGIIGLIDPPREEAAEAICVAKRAGIRTIMITGDHAATAGAIAKELGLTDSADAVITGKQLSMMSDESLSDNISDYSVYARVSPEDKIRIVEAWQEHDEVVAMTGDGVNDAPALKAADVGIAMGQAGTEVAKSASDIVLTDDNFATIIAAVKEGRNVFANIRKTLYFLLVCNMSEIVIILGAQLAGWGIALTPVMLLLINVLGDGIPGLSLAREEGDSRLMRRKPIGRDESFFGGGLLKVIIQQAIAFAVVGLIAYYLGSFVHLPGGIEPSHGVGQTMAFLVIAFTSVLHIFTVRTRQSIFKSSVRGNMTMVYSVIAMIILFAAMALIEPFGAIFGITPIGAFDWLVVIVLTIIPTLVAEAFKLWDNRCEIGAYRRRVMQHEIDEDRFCA